MGTVRRRLLSDSEICRLYTSGLSRIDIGYRAKLYDREILTILKANGVPLRSTEEARRLWREERARRRAA